MRIQGKLSRWNDDRGFGFITPTNGGAEVFVHISAFPRDGQRPRLDEALSFESGLSKDGKTRAINVQRPGGAAERSGSAARRPRSVTRRTGAPRVAQHQRHGWGGLRRTAYGVIVVILCAAGYAAWHDRQGANVHATRETQGLLVTPEDRDANRESFRCDGRTQCSQMTSCAEAMYFLEHCPSVQMDGNHDGEPCEQQWCN
jgi:cold shock CspA family protein